jgi:hypothetical protein
MGLPLTGVGFNGAVGSPDNIDPLPEGPVSNDLVLVLEVQDHEVLPIPHATE